MVECQEKMFFFEGSQGKKLLGFLHLPIANRRPIGILYCHGFAEEKNCSHAVVVKAARTFARLGFAVMRFDLSGCGDSEGDLEEVTLDDWRSEIQQAMAQFQAAANIEKVALWGLRHGAGMVLLQAAMLRKIPFVILWHPVIEFKEYIHQFLRQLVGAGLVGTAHEKDSVKSVVAQLQSGNPVEVAGYPISPELYASFLSVGDLPRRVEIKCPLFIATVSLMDKAPFALEKFAASLAAKSPAVHFTHVQAEPFWDRYWCWNSPDLTAKTLNWLDAWK
jgi:exosortase A-associated hydrolase 2